VSGEQLVEGWRPRNVADLQPDDLAPLFALQPTVILLGTGTRVVSTEKLHAQGNLIQTQNAFDLAISGEGFFQILQPDGTIAYTRDGGFKVSGEGVLVNSSGYRLQPELAIPQNAQTITIGADGTVSIQAFGEAQAQTIGQIQLARFLSPTGLQAIGHLLDVATEGGDDLGIGGFGDGDVAVLGEGDGAGDDGVLVEELMDVVAGLRRHALGEGDGRDEERGGKGGAKEEGTKGCALGNSGFHAHTIVCAYA
jgi:flagellar basal-body rod protein FlgG